MRRIALNGLVPTYLFLCIVLGGASAAGYWANLLLQLLAVPMLAAAIIARLHGPAGRAARQLLMLAGLVAAIVLVQLVPLPPSVWTALPGRGHVREGFELLGQALPWLPISLDPHATAAAALWMLPASAVLLGVLRIGTRESWLAWTIIVATALSVLIGALQIAGGQENGWYPYRITNYGVTVGFFANANHMATLLIVTVPFLGALLMAARARSRGAQKSAGLVVILAGLFALVVVGLAINGSLAGLGLMLPVSGATLMLLLRRRRMPGWAVAGVLLLTAAAVGAVFSGRFAANLINEEAQTGVISRYTASSISLRAAADHLPFGSGLGTFQPVYRLYEDAGQVTTTYYNHAHNDWVELLLETGLPGAVLLLLFLLWWIRRTFAIWRAPETDPFARAATIASAAILAHSLVDYPLRTAAISAIFAACLAVMADRRIGGGGNGKRWPAKRPSRHLSAD